MLRMSLASLIVSLTMSPFSIAQQVVPVDDWKPALRIKMESNTLKSIQRVASNFKLLHPRRRVSRAAFVIAANS